MELRAQYFNNSPAYELQSPSIDGRRVASEKDLSALFLERIFKNRTERRAGFTRPPRKSFQWSRVLHGAYERMFDDRELFMLIGLLNSVPFDFLMRTKVDSHIVKYKLEESQVPRLTEGDDWFEYIWRRAARLNCYGEAFAEMRERLGGLEPSTETAQRRRLQAQLDAAAFHAYGLDRKQTAFVLDDFHRVQNPRVMDEAYFDSVLEFYEELAETGPLP